MTPAAGRSPHVVELQTIRGFAAATVMIYHALRTIANDGWAWKLSEVPLNARGAVVLFFVLSGYVLACSLLRNGSLGTFYVRRAFRIYPALWVATLLGAAYFLLVRPLGAPDMAGWAQRHYDPAQVGVWKVIGSFVGADTLLLPTSWTITVELGASVLLPGIVWLLLRHRWAAVPLLLAVLPMGLMLGYTARRIPFYLGAFALGAALACVPVAGRIRPSPPITLTAAATLMLSQIVVPAELRWGAMIAEALASAVLIAGIVAHGVSWMRVRPLVALGDWSYSIYLLHLPIAYSIVRVADHAGLVARDRDLTAVMVAAATVMLTVPLSAVIYRFVERPGIDAGSALLNRVRTLRRPGPAIS